MRPVSEQNSALKTPLNNILGFEGNVRLLRSLIEARNAVSHSGLADRTGLSLPGVHKVVSRMIKTGIIQYTGSGKQQQVELREDHPLSGIIRELFEAEKANYDSLIKELKEEIGHLSIKPESAWIFGKVAQGTDEYGDPTRIAVLGDVRSVDEMVESLRDRLRQAEIEKKFDVTIEIQGVTSADIEHRRKMNAHKIIILRGPDPQFYLAGSKDERENMKRTHQEFDRQSLIDSRVWSELLQTYPEIIQRTIEYLEERLPHIESGERHELEEWKHILESMSQQRLKKFLESDSERATRLRQSLPFWPVLTEKERMKLEEIRSNQLQVHD